MLATLTPCKTDVAILFVGIPDAHDVLRFPSNAPEAGFPGLHVTLQPALGVGEQLTQALSGFLGVDVGRHLEVNATFADELKPATGPAATLYVAVLRMSGVVAEPAWPSLPDVLRSLPRDKGRVPYLRSWQVLTGGYQLNTKAASLEEALKHLRD